MTFSGFGTSASYYSSLFFTKGVEVNRMTKPNEETIEKALRNTQASMELSCFTITEEHKEIVRLKLTGEISEEEFFKLVLKRVTGK